MTERFHSQEPTGRAADHHWIPNRVQEFIFGFLGALDYRNINRGKKTKNILENTEENTVAKQNYP